MKTKEFIKRVEELGYLVDDGYGNWQIWNAKSPIIATVSKIDLFRFSTDFVGWCNIPDEDKSKLLDIIIEFAKTPIEDREEEKRYYLRHKWIRKDYDFNYLCFDEDFKLYTLSTCNSKEWKIEFTEEEVEELKEKFNTDLSDFELVEVE